MQAHPLFSRSLTAVVLAALSVSAALATTHNVPGDFATIQAALNAAQPGDVVVVADGTYTGPGNVDLDFLGKAVTLRSANGPGSCTIECNGSTTNPHRGLRFVSGETAAATVEGLTIRSGVTRVGAIDDQFNGAAILCNNSSPTIRNCVLENNVAACWGGAVCCSNNASPTLINCTIRNNQVGDDGGALFAWGESHPTLINCALSGNESGGTGGAITSFNFSNGPPVTVRNCTIVGNTSNWYALYGGRFDVANSIVWSNTTAQGQIYEMTTNAVRYSIVQGGYSGAGAGPGILSVNPGFVSADDLRLAAGSACIDSGDNAAISSDVAGDIAGELRFENDPGTVDSGVSDGTRWTVDRGAHEFQGNSCPGEIDGDGVVALGDLAWLLSEFGSQGHLWSADLDRDDDVDLSDLAMLLGNFGSTCP